MTDTRRITIIEPENRGLATYVRLARSGDDWATSSVLPLGGRRIEIAISVSGPGMSLMELASRLESFADQFQITKRASDDLNFQQGQSSEWDLTVGETRLTVSITIAETTAVREIKAAIGAFLREMQKQRVRQL